MGVGRSGTSLVQSMLASHPEFAFPPETSFIRRFIVGGYLDGQHQKKGWAGVKRILREDRVLGRLEVSLGELINEFETAGEVFSSVRLYERILEFYASQQGKPGYGDKDPRLIEFLPILHRYWPNSRIIHIIRDPRDVLASKKKAAWSKDRNPLLHIFANKVQMKLGDEWGERLFGSNYIKIIYENLLHDPETTLKTLCQQLGIDFHPDMLSFGKAAERIVSAEEMSWKKETLGPLLRNNQGKWKKDLTETEVTLCERVLPELSQKGIYQPSLTGKKLPVGLSLKTSILSFLMEAAAKVYCIHRNVRVQNG